MRDFWPVMGLLAFWGSIPFIFRATNPPYTEFVPPASSAILGFTSIVAMLLSFVWKKMTLSKKDKLATIALYSQFLLIPFPCMCMTAGADSGCTLEGAFFLCAPLFLAGLIAGVVAYQSSNLTCRVLSISLALLAAQGLPPLIYDYWKYSRLPASSVSDHEGCHTPEKHFV